MDVTPLVPQGRQVIERYGNGGFRVTGETYRGSILVLPDRSAAWPPTSIDELDLASLEPVLSAVPPVEVLLIGCGRAMAMIDPALRAAARARGVALEPMDRSEEHTSELQSLMRISYDVICLKKNSINSV